MNKNNGKSKSGSKNCGGRKYNKSTNNRSKAGKQRMNSEESNRTADRASNQDFSWYNNYPALTLSTCQVPFNNCVGLPVRADLGLLKEWSPDAPNTILTAPGIMTFDVMPTIGDAKDKESAVNVSSRALYTFVRHVNSGHVNYDAPDLMMYIVAMDSLTMFHEYLKRAYGVLSLNHPLNRYYPRGLVAAMGLDYDDLIANMPNLLYYINNFATKISSMVVPATIPLFERHKFMFSGYYADVNNLKGQVYMFRPGYLWVIDPMDKEGTTLKAVSVCAQNEAKHFLSFSDLVKIGDQLINAIAWNEDFNIMSGDLLKAFGYDKIRKFETIDTNYTVLPTSMAEMPYFTDQVSNMTVMHVDVSEAKISQNPNVGGGEIIADYGVAIGDFIPHAEEVFLNTRNIVVSPENVMEMTRLVHYIDADNKIHAGSEIITRMGTVKFDSLNEWEWYSWKQYVKYEYDPSTAYPAFQVAVAELCSISAFDYHPTIWIAAHNTSNDSVGSYPMQDLCNFTTITKEQLQRIHDTAILSLFVVPNVNLALNK